MVPEHIDAKRLEIPLDLTPPSDKHIEDEIVTKILEAVYHAQNPMILVDMLTSRFHCTPEARQLVDITRFPVCPSLSAAADLVFWNEFGEGHPE